MTVAQLIHALQECDKNASVLIWNENDAKWQTQLSLACGTTAHEEGNENELTVSIKKTITRNHDKKINPGNVVFLEYQ